jgi:hypothetical protein
VSTDSRGHEENGPFSLERFGGGRQPMLVAAAAGALGLALTFLGGMAAPQEALISYLTSFVFWLGVALGGLILVMAFNTARARWMIVLRRAMETLHAALPIFVLLFLPILLGARRLFAWIEPSAAFGKEALKIIADKHGYLNLPWFTIRFVLYFAVFIAVSHLLYRWSNRQDVEPDPERSAQLTRQQRRLSAGGLPFVALALTFASFDWLLSLNPLFFSTMFGLYYFSGAFLSAIAVLIVATALLRHQPDTHGPHVGLAHYHNLGKLLLAFTAFWAYIGFSQFMLIWIGNLPEELPWFIARTQGPWKPVFYLLVFGHFLVPFFLLLSKDLKLRPRALAAVATWILIAHWIDLYWVVVPTFHRDHVVFHWTQVTAFAGVGGIAVAFALFRARGRYAVPVGDPYLADSLRYSQP